MHLDVQFLVKRRVLACVLGVARLGLMAHFHQLYLPQLRRLLWVCRSWRLPLCWYDLGLGGAGSLRRPIVRRE